MLQSKIFTVLDAATEMRVIATRLHPDSQQPEGHLEQQLIQRAGWGADQIFGEGVILLTSLSSYETQYDVYSWGSGARTLPTAHAMIIAEWDTLDSGDTIDVRDWSHLMPHLWSVN